MRTAPRNSFTATTLPGAALPPEASPASASRVWIAAEWRAARTSRRIRATPAFGSGSTARWYPRADARISIFDGGFVAGDGVWEGLRLHRGTLLFLDEHLDRLFQGARAIDLEIGLPRAALAEALWTTLRANDMQDGVHIRPDGDARDQAHAQPGPAQRDRPATAGDRRRAQGSRSAAARDRAHADDLDDPLHARRSCSTCGSIRTAGST